jgi:hypothetical protein
MSKPGLKELAYRSQNGLEVTLLWDPRSNAVSLEVIDQLGDSPSRLSVDDHGRELAALTFVRSTGSRWRA